MPSPRATLIGAALVSMFTLAACQREEPAPHAAASGGVGHVLVDSASGIVLDLPVNWRGRYRVASGVTEQVEGLSYELTLRYVQADATVSDSSPLLIARIFTAEAWERLAADTLSTRFGAAIGGDSLRRLVLRPASTNPFTVNTPDAESYDSLMLAIFERPFRATLRPMN